MLDEQTRSLSAPSPSTCCVLRSDNSQARLRGLDGVGDELAAKVVGERR